MAYGAAEIWPDEVAAKVCCLVARQFDMDESEVTADWRLVDDLGADSYSMVELLVALESAFGRQLRDLPPGDLNTVGDVIQHVQQIMADVGRT
jgi:acyl carrier protein